MNIPCDTCDGSGEVEYPSQFAPPQPCHDCDGSGEVPGPPPPQEGA